MKFYEITIAPLSGFGTLLKGDTLFGHICWQAAYNDDLLNGGLEKRISAYSENPFAVFSSAFPKLNRPSPCYALKRPDVPQSLLFSIKEEDRVRQLETIKEKKKKKWMLADESLNPDISEADFLTDKELFEEIAEQASEEIRRITEKADHPGELTIPFSQPHNTINRRTGTTGKDAFAPYSQDIVHYYPETKLAIFALIDESATDIERICDALKKIGRWGYGKDASVGMGRFEVREHRELPLPDAGDANACYTLAPCVPEKGCFSKSYFIPFVRFGKHGDRGALSGKPFKNPVVMADEGAVFKPDTDTNIFEKPYMGRAVSGVSKYIKNTVVQGYAPYLPLKIEGLK